MKWFFNWVRRGINNLDDHLYEEEAKMNTIPTPRVRNRAGLVGVAKAASMDGSINLHQQAMHFKIYPATGGHIVEYTYYNERKDNHDQALHLIPSELDLGSELAKIMTLEALKR
jgi:hypothetical protein